MDPIRQRNFGRIRHCVRLWAAAGVILLIAAAACHPPGTSADVPLGTHVVIAFNDLGMHCMQQDFSEMMILPPFNTVHAQVIRRGGEPHIVRSGVSVRFLVPGNTHSSDKANFWEFAPQLLGVTLSPNYGLTGTTLSGQMTYAGNDWYSAEGIPITPIDDSGIENPYPLATVIVEQNGQSLAKTQTVVPVSWEMNCDLCHNTPGISVGTDVLRAHDRLHGTSLEAKKPVLCAGCHSDAALGLPGKPGVPSLSRAMHGAHAPRMAQAKLDVECYACHPGLRTRCLRSVHASKGMKCTDCHGNMTNVANPNRRPWLDEPRCGECHERAGFEFEQPGVLYRNSRGHGGVACPTCHGSPHAITPTTTEADNVQAVALQGSAGKISKCTVCHTTQPGDSFFHSVND